ncbi:MAG: S8 family peptidase [Bacteroidetes bacterium]|nr:S8 family peptidase [Bacteroidota bacterium]
MKHIYTLLCLAAFSTGIMAQTQAYPAPQLSAATRYFLWRMEKQGNDRPVIAPEFVYKQDAQNTIYLSSLVKVQPGYNGASLAALGAHVGTKAGDVWTVQVPVQKVKEFTQLNGLYYIDMDQPTAMELDSARKTTHVDSVHNGINLPQVYNGENVVVGVIDVGLDYTHPTFYDTTYSFNRIQRVWEEKTIGTPPAGFPYGTEYATTSAILTKGHDMTTEMHGSHVTGIAAGSGAGGPGGNSRIYRGMAYKSDIVMVGIYPTSAYWLNTGMTDMLDGMHYIFNYAQSVSKPAVANLSWGCPLGPHDGNSLFSQACNNLVGKGKIFVLSAGNNGTNNIHLQKTFAPADTMVNTIVTFPAGLTNKVNWVDVWGQPGKSFCMEFSLYYGTTKVTSSAKICLDNTTHQVNLIGTNADTCFVTVTAVPNEFNGKPHMLIQVYSRAAATNRLCFTLKGTSGTVDMWQGYVQNASGYYGSFSSAGYTWAVNGDALMNISDMATTEGAITVGAYNSKVSFQNVSGQVLSYSGYTVGAIAPFSSHGPTADGRTKPNITGPGLALASAVNSTDPDYMSTGSSYNSVVSTYTSPVNSQVYSYAMAGGTSMSSPATSGIVALLLQANPALSPDMVLNILYQTAIQDSYTGTITAPGSNTWGYGKVNAYRALVKTLETVGIYHQDQSLNCILFPNPGKGDYTLQYNSLVGETLQITVTDMNGRELQHESWTVNQGYNTRSIDLGHFAAGMYFTKITSSKTSAVIKIVKQ